MVVVLMGVSGSGKTAVGEALARRLGWPFQEGDALHPRANIEKMHAGHPLTDEDRAPWLAAIAEWVEGHVDAVQDGVITSSALKRRYREMIDRRRRGVMFVFLHGGQTLIAARLAARRGHFMPAELLVSQLRDLEPPGPDEPAIAIDVAPPPDVIAQQIINVINDVSDSKLIDANLKALTDWRGKRLSQLRAAIKKADPGIVEEIKWRKPSRPEGVPVWSHDGIVCIGEALKSAVRLTFPKGALVKDPKKLFNARLDSNSVRAVDFHEGDGVDEAALKALILDAVRVNAQRTTKR